MQVKVTPEGLIVGEELLPVYSGSVHYWRLECDLWGPILDNVKGMGFQMICTYIPWVVHEIERGDFDFGQVDARKDIDAFLTLCEEKGLKTLVRPGPHINAELTRFGYPQRIIMDPEIQARTSHDSPALIQGGHFIPPKQFPVPSYASEKFYQEVGLYFDALCPILNRHLAPGGCIVAVQSDNETCYFFRDGVYDLDYHPESIALYHRMLRDKYGQIEVLNERYSANYTDFEAVEPPRDFEAATRMDLPRHFDWVEYKEYQIIYCLTRIARMFRERGVVGAPIFFDVAWQYYTPLDIIDLEAQPDMDWVGMNLYRNREDYADVRRKMKYLAGSTVLPFVPELGSGVWCHHPRTFTPEEEEFVTLSAFMHGLKAVNYYMIVERERWQGCPVTRDNRRRPEYYDFYTKFNAFLRDSRFHRFRKECDILVLLNYDLGRFGALYSTLDLGYIYMLDVPDALRVPEVDLGFARDLKAEADDWNEESWFGQVVRTLKENYYDYNLSDTHLPLERLQAYPLVCLPTFDFMNLALQEKLLAYVRRGGRLVIGPMVPYLDMGMRKGTVLGRYLQGPGEVNLGEGKLICLEEVTLDGILGETPVRRPFTLSNPALDLTAHSDGQRTIVFVANPTPEGTTVELRFSGAKRFRDLWGDEGELEGIGGVLLELPPYNVEIWEALP